MENIIIFVAITISLFVSIESKPQPDPKPLELWEEWPNLGSDCWSNCNRKQGKCSWCGRQGYCCRVDWSDKSNGCDGSVGGYGNHACVPPPEGSKGSKCDYDLINGINDYRAQKGLPRIAADETLCKVAWYHSWDQLYGKSGGHSWGANSKDGYSWKTCDFDSDGYCMWDAPKQFNSAWKGQGFEVSFWHSEKATASNALLGWKNGKSHNAVLLNRNGGPNADWSKRKWTRLGAAVVGENANAWFAE